MLVEDRESSADVEQLSASLKLLADPRRLQILELLMDGVQCNCEICNHLDMAPNLISHHLSALRRAGLVLAERDPHDARWIYFSIDELRLSNLREELEALLDPRRIKPRRPECGPRVARTAG